MDPPVPQGEDSPRPPSLTHILANGNNGTSIPGLEGGTIDADSREILKKFSNAIPFFLLLLTRFLVAYISKFFSLLFINTTQYRFHVMFDEQISLKSSTDRSILWSLFTFSLGTLTLIYLTSPLVIGSDVTERLMFHEFHPESIDFISIIMLCYFADTTLRLVIGTIKIAIYFILNPRGRSTDNSAVSPFPNLACLPWNCVSFLSSFNLPGLFARLRDITFLSCLFNCRF